MNLDTSNTPHSPQNLASKFPKSHAYIPERAAMELAAPWSNSPRRSMAKYPGRHKIWRAIFGHDLALQTMHSWRIGYRDMPGWARDRLAAHLERDAQARWDAAQALRNEKPG